MSRSALLPLKLPLLLQPHHIYSYAISIAFVDLLLHSNYLMKTKAIPPLPSSPPSYLSKIMTDFHNLILTRYSMLDHLNPHPLHLTIRIRSLMTSYLNSYIRISLAILLVLSWYPLSTSQRISVNEHWTSPLSVYTLMQATLHKQSSVLKLFDLSQSLWDSSHSAEIWINLAESHADNSKDLHSALYTQGEDISARIDGIYPTPLSHLPRTAPTDS